jgi:hypothetical protein
MYSGQYCDDLNDMFPLRNPVSVSDLRYDEVRHYPGADISADGHIPQMPDMYPYYGNVGTYNAVDMYGSSGRAKKILDCQMKQRVKKLKDRERRNAMQSMRLQVEQERLKLKSRQANAIAAASVGCGPSRGNCGVKGGGCNCGLERMTSFGGFSLTLEQQHVLILVIIIVSVVLCMRSVSRIEQQIAELRGLDKKIITV